jgi:lipid II:glycine glycyltransferase (peptidoglycan interpeptide bridge formation enzyme)
MNKRPIAEISNDTEDKSCDDFVAQKPSGNHVQTSLWAQVKSELGWKPYRIKILTSGEITAGAQILKRDLKLLGPIG